MKTARLYTAALFSDDYFILFRGASRPSSRAWRSFDPKLRERQESSRLYSSRENRGSLAYRKRALLFKSLLFPHGLDLNISLSPSFDSCQLACNEAPSCWNSENCDREACNICILLAFSFSTLAMPFYLVLIVLRFLFHFIRRYVCLSNIELYFYSFYLWFVFLSLL